MYKRFLETAASVVLLFLTIGYQGCASTNAYSSADGIRPSYSVSDKRILVPKSTTKKKSTRRTQIGIASWYGPGFNGKKTASGEIFNMNHLTAAHKKLPFGTKVKVINLSNNKSVVVVINDIGPYKKGRIIDLSKAAAKKIGLLKTGTARVKLIILEK